MKCRPPFLILPVLLAIVVAAPVQASEPIPLDKEIGLAAVGTAGPLNLTSVARAIEVAGEDTGEAWIALTSTTGPVFADYTETVGAGVAFVQTDNGTIPHADGDVSFTATRFGDNYRAFITPHPSQAEGPRITLDTTSMHTRPSPVSSVEAFDPLQVRPRETVDVEDTQVLRDFGPRITLLVEGSFRLRLWDINGTLSAGDGETDVFSGEHFKPLVPVSGTELVAREGEARLLIFDVVNGSARFELPGENVLRIFADAADGTVQGSVAGYTESGGAPSHKRTGLLDVSLAPNPNRDSLTLVLSRPLSAGSGSESVDPQSQASEEQEDEDWHEPLSNVPAGPGAGARGVLAWWPMMALAAAVILTGGRMFRNHRFRRMFRSVERDFDAQNYEAVITATKPLLRSRRHRWDAGTMAIVASVRLAETEQAMEFLAKVESFREADDDALDYLTACIAAARGDDSQAAKVVEGLVARNETYADDVASTPLLSKTAKPSSTSPFEGYA